MIDRWNIDNQMTELVASILCSSPANSIHPLYINLPNKEYLYSVEKGRKLLECENDKDLSLYVYPDDIKETNYSNCKFRCDFYVVVGIVRKKDTLIPDFNKIKSAITLFFGADGMDIVHLQLTDGNETIENARIGSFGISNVQIQSTSRQTDKCGICNFQALVKFTIYFNRI